MPLMIDAEPLLSLLANVDTANAGRQRIVALYRAHEQPNAAQTEQFLKDYQSASVTWANACGAVCSGQLGHAVVAAQQTE
jgi:hypothetical protein